MGGAPSKSLYNRTGALPLRRLRGCGAPILILHLLGPCSAIRPVVRWCAG